MPGQFGPALERLRTVAPTLHMAVPKGWEMLAQHLDQDPALNRQFWSGMQVPFYAAASLPQPLWDQLGRLSDAATGPATPRPATSAYRSAGHYRHPHGRYARPLPCAQPLWRPGHDHHRNRGPPPLQLRPHSPAHARRGFSGRGVGDPRLGRAAPGRARTHPGRAAPPPASPPGSRLIPAARESDPSSRAPLGARRSRGNIRACRPWIASPSGSQ